MYTILAIDDERAGLLTRQLVLENAGYHVLAASDADQGLSFFRNADVDLVLMDYYLPGMSGAVASREMKALNRRCRSWSSAALITSRKTWTTWTCS